METATNGNGSRLGQQQQQEQQQPEWVQAHEVLSRLARERAAADAEEGRWLLCALRSAAHVHLGFGGFAEYVERLFGYKPRSTHEKLRVAEALEELPRMHAALAGGELGWSAARELTRVATADTEEAWLEVARGKTVRQLEELVAGKSPGDGPHLASREQARRHVLRFEVAAETLAIFREAMSRLRRMTELALDDDSALLLMARHVLGGPTDEGRSSYQVALTVCQECGAGHQQTAGELLRVSADVVEMADCDAQQLGRIPVRIEKSAHVGAAGSAGAGAPARERATQSIPPAVRRRVLRRDQHCCVVPGCRNSTYVDIHHLHLRSEGGQHEPDLLITLCGAHHRSQHRGQLLIEGTVSAGLSFRHADGTSYGAAPSSHAADAFTKAFKALASMGFPEGQARRALEAVRKNHSVARPEVKEVIRDALRFLTPTPAT